LISTRNVRVADPLQVPDPFAVMTPVLLAPKEVVDALQPDGSEA
jgi:hypothetical protein